MQAHLFKKASSITTTVTKLGTSRCLQQPLERLRKRHWHEFGMPDEWKCRRKTPHPYSNGKYSCTNQDVGDVYTS